MRSKQFFAATSAVVLSFSVSAFGQLAPLTETFNLSSFPTATKTIYLDFDGHTTQDPGWEGGATFTTPAFDPSDNGPAFISPELQRIQYIWQRISEDFAPFNVNVTTKEPPIEDLRRSGAGDTRWGVRVVIGNNTRFSPAGGLALYNSFNSDRDTPCFVFEDGLANGNEKYVADAASHEVGHTLGLAHDGRTSPSEGYYGGHGSGVTGWGPIMGAPYGVNLTQWSKGEYANADQKQDDLAVITGNNGFGYRTDDFGNTPATASALPMTDSTNFSFKGLISQNTDRDVFNILTAGGSLNVTLSVADRGANLDALLELLDVAGNVIASSNPIDQLGANLSLSLLPGQYFLRVDGVGFGDPLAIGYSDYGSLGTYTLSGSLVPALVPEPALASLGLLAFAALRRRRA